MTDPDGTQVLIERFQAARAHLARSYADAAARLAQAVKDDPASNAWSHFSACVASWHALCEVDAILRAHVFAGDPIDDFHREGAGGG